MALLPNGTVGVPVFLDSMNSPTPVAPVFPDFATCDIFYGQHLPEQDARSASAQLPFGGLPVDYMLNSDRHEHHIPSTFNSGLITVRVEHATPFDPRVVQSIRLTPNDLRGMADYVSERCVKQEGIGGFVTTSISNIMDHVIKLDVDIAELPYPPETLFVTVTVGSRGRNLPPPGNYDHTIASALKEAELRAMAGASPTLKDDLKDRASRWKRQALIMRSTMTPWWDFQTMNSNLASKNQTETSDISDASRPFGFEHKEQADSLSVLKRRKWRRQ